MINPKPTRKLTKNAAGRAMAGAAAAALLLSACSSTSTKPSAAKNTTTTAPKSSTSSSSSLPAASVTAWIVSNGSTNATITAAAKEFDQKHPNDHITVSFYSNSPYKTKLELSMSANDAPTMFFGWGGGVLEQYVNAHDVLSLGDPSWLKDFLPATLDAVTFDGKTYAVPIEGTQPEFFFYNKKVLDSIGLKTFPTTWSGLLAAAAKLKAKGITPFALADAAGWPGLIYLEYLTQRIGGTSVYDAIAAGKSDAWSNPAVTAALKDMVSLVHDGYFQDGYDAEHFATGASDALVYTGRAAMQLMGNWDISSILAKDKTFIDSGDMGQAPFPAVSGGKGNPADLSGNVATYVSISSHASPAQQKVAEAFMRTELTSTSYAKAQVAAGEVPVIKGSAGLLKVSNIGKLYLASEYAAVEKAPVFTYSWDQALGEQEGDTLDTNVASLLAGTENISQFEKVMNAQHPTR